MINIVPNNREEVIISNHSEIYSTPIGDYRLESRTATFHNGITVNLN